MAEFIQATPPVTYMQPRPQKREREKRGFEFAHWLADEAAANDMIPGEEKFPVPLMSPEGVLVLAQAQEEEFALAAHTYETVANSLAGPSDLDDAQYELNLPVEHIDEAM